MISPQSQKVRTYLFNIINNNFEPFLRHYIQEHILDHQQPTDKWKENVPEYTLAQAAEKLKTTNFGINEFMTTLYLFDLKSIMIYKNNFDLCRNLVGQNLMIEQFGELMDRLNDVRDRVDHPYELNTDALEATIYRIRTLCNNANIAKSMLEYLEQCRYEHGVAPPPTCINNLRQANYDSDGGFITRPEIKNLLDKINKRLNRIINIIGSGGVGKTAIAEYICHHYLTDRGNPFYAILFYSAKEKRLTERGITEIDPTLSEYGEFINDLHSNLIPQHVKKSTSIEEKETEIYDFVDETKGNHRCLIVIDNLENPAIISDKKLRKFINEFPRNAQIILTSRIGTDMPEERVKITEMNVKQAIELLKRYALTRFRNRTNIYELGDEDLTKLVNKVHRIPLLIKFAVGRNVELGQTIELAFHVESKKDKEAINFMLSETYAMLTPQAKIFLECIAVHKSNKISRAALIEMTSEFDIDKFEEMIQQVEAVSLVKREIVDMEEFFIIDQIANRFVQDLLTNNETERKKIINRYAELLTKIDNARDYLTKNKIEGIGVGLKESEYLAASHIADAISYHSKRNLNPHKAYDDASKEFNIAKQIAPWWYHIYMEQAYFEASWNHPDVANELLNEAKNKNPKCVDYAKYQQVIQLIHPSELKVGQILNVVIKQVGKKGDGIAFHEKRAVIVEGGAVGESLKIKITGMAKYCAFAEIINKL